MAATTFTACSAGTPSRSRPTSTFTNTSQAVVAASEYAQAPSRSTRVGVRPWAMTTAKIFRAGPTSRRTARTFVAAAPRSISSVVGRGIIMAGSGRRTAVALGHLEVEEARGVQPEQLGAGVVAEPAHGALDRLRGVWPRALMVRIVVAPEEVVHEVIALGQR